VVEIIYGLVRKTCGLYNWQEPGAPMQANFILCAFVARRIFGIEKGLIEN